MTATSATRRSRVAARALAAALASACLALAAAAPDAWAQRPLPVEVTGATYAEYDQRTGAWLLRGRPVVITRQGARMTASQVTYREAAGSVTAVGNVTVSYRTTVLRAARVDARLADDYVRAQGNVVVIDRRPDGEIRLLAAQAEAWLASRRLAAAGRPVLTHPGGRLSGNRLTYEGQTQVATFAGNAELVLAQGRLWAERIDGHLARQTAEAQGNVRFAGRSITGEARRARVNQKSDTAVLVGEAVIRRGSDTLTAETITIDLRVERAVATGNPRLVIGPRS